MRLRKTLFFGLILCASIYLFTSMDQKGSAFYRYHKVSNSVIFNASYDVQYEWLNKSNVYGLIQSERTTKSFWPYNYKYIINNEHICTGSPIFLITFVSSCVNHFSRRNIVRRNWAPNKKSQKKKIKVIFLLGMTLNSTIQENIQKESEMYGDIVQGNFIDSYKNMTFKNVMGLKWVAKFCNHSTFVLKIDDDTWVHVVNFMKVIGHAFINNTIFCKVNKDVSPHRYNNSKWHITYKEYPLDTYPPYCDGGAYIFSPNIAEEAI